MILALPAALVARSATVMLAWDPNSETNLVTYRLRAAGPITNVYETGLSTNVTVTNLASGSTWRFTVTAVNNAGLESDPSNEVTWTTPAGLPPVDGYSARTP